MCVSGDPKTGKTHFACTFPEPIALFSFDLGADYVVGKFPGKKIDIKKYRQPMVDTSDKKPESIKLYKQLKQDYTEACTSGEYQTIVLDTGSALRDILYQAYIEEKSLEGSKSKPGRLDWTTPNLWTTWFIMLPQYNDVNLVAIHYLKDIYVGSEPSGEKKLDGYGRTPGITDIVARTSKETKVIERQKQRVFTLSVTDNRYEPDMDETDISNPTYDKLILMLGWEE